MFYVNHSPPMEVAQSSGCSCKLAKVTHHMNISQIESEHQSPACEGAEPVRSCLGQAAHLAFPFKHHRGCSVRLEGAGDEGS